MTKICLFYDVAGVSSLDTLQPQIDNSAFVNAISHLALLAPGRAFSMLGKSVTQFDHFAKALFLPYDDIKHFHPAFDGYKICEHFLLVFFLMVFPSYSFYFDRH